MTDIEEPPAASSTDSDPAPAANPHATDSLFASIRAALAPGASAEARAIGATACRAILATLAPKSSPHAAASARATPAASPLAALLPQLGALLPQLATIPADQLRELFGTLLRGVLPSGRPAATTLRYRAVPLRAGHRPDGG